MQNRKKGWSYFVGSNVLSGKYEDSIKVSNWAQGPGPEILFGNFRYARDLINLSDRGMVSWIELWEIARERENLLDNLDGVGREHCLC